MALKHNEIKYTRTLNDEDTLYIDSAKAAAYVKDIRSGLEEMHDVYINIAKAYEKLANHKDTKGVYKTSVASAKKAAKNRADYCRNRKSEIKSRLEKDIQNYTNKLLGEKVANLEKVVAELQSQANKTDNS